MDDADASIKLLAQDTGASGVINFLDNGDIGGNGYDICSYDGNDQYTCSKYWTAEGASQLPETEIDKTSEDVTRRGGPSGPPRRLHHSSAECPRLYAQEATYRG